MTWLPVDSAAASERDAVLGLQPEGRERLDEVLEISWSITDSSLLDLCRLRLAQLLRCRAELAPADDGHLLAELAEWRSSAAYSERERAALAYAEQFLVDQNGITEEQKAEISRHLSRRELVDFVQALNVQEGYLRVLTVLDVAPDPGISPHVHQPLHEVMAAEAEDVPGTGLDLLVALTDPAFWEARMAFGAAMARQSGVDAETSEVCRLRNANHQACRY